jgi:hypothetical protein
MITWFPIDRCFVSVVRSRNHIWQGGLVSWNGNRAPERRRTTLVTRAVNPLDVAVGLASPEGSPAHFPVAMREINPAS